MIELSKVRIDGELQPRAELNQDTIAEYAEAYKSGAKFPPVKLFFDGSSYWLADGFHRYSAARDAGLTTIYEEIIPGSRRDALLFSRSANDGHGLRRSNADKRKTVLSMLVDAEWSRWTDVNIAKACAVSSNFVGDMRSIINPINDSQQPANRTVQRNGTTYQQNTANIGRKNGAAKPEPEQQEAIAPAEPAEEAPPEYTALDQAMDTVRDLQDALALANAGDLSEEDKTQAADLIARLREEVRILTLKLRAVTASRDQYQTENGELKRQILRQRREIDKITGTKTA